MISAIGGIRLHARIRHVSSCFICYHLQYWRRVIYRYLGKLRTEGEEAGAHVELPVRSEDRLLDAEV